MKFLLSAISLLVLGNCSREQKETRSIRTDTVMAGRTQQNDDSATNAESVNRPAARPGGWTYEKTVDKAGSAVYKASVTASNLIQFAYPYTGGSTATLTIRERDGNAQVYIEVSNGQFNRSFQNGSARVRFDNKPLVTYSLSAAANGRANIVFFDAERRLIDQIKTARNTSIQVRFDGQPVRQIEFKTAGLRWNH